MGGGIEDIVKTPQKRLIVPNRESEIQRITDVFLESTGKIESVYFQLPVVGNEKPKFRERVYCYELYHQMRSRWPNDSFPYRITGEIDKSGHPLIHQGHLMCSKPDFTVHVPRSMNDNLIVVEVKPRGPKDSRILKDLRKLTAYREFAGYGAAFYLVYGYDEAGARSFARHCKTLAAGDVEIDLGKIKLFNHAEPMSKASDVAWPA